MFSSRPGPQRDTDESISTAGVWVSSPVTAGHGDWTSWPDFSRNLAALHSSQHSRGNEGCNEGAVQQPVIRSGISDGSGREPVTVTSTSNSRGNAASIVLPYA
ncbi:hypothetical protein ROHU_019249 [Labeo rohita]|uniref:Uncharacterized protein n=1 Tax=Labeo rohita TaxID=84645 RepID=A0A498N398_LABRO|nr:hypothetical protein ROHU_019249 [Labeo rohita]